MIGPGGVSRFRLVRCDQLVGFNQAFVANRGGFGDIKFVEYQGQRCALKESSFANSNRIISGKIKVCEQPAFPFMISYSRVQQAFRNEELVLSHSDHPHIVRYIASVYYPVSIRHGLLMERADMSLLRYLENNRSNGIVTWEHVISFSKDILHGLIYLADRRIYHLDLKSSNVLLFMQARLPLCKLCDFGCVWKQSFMVEYYFSRFSIELRAMYREMTMW